MFDNSYTIGLWDRKKLTFCENRENSFYPFCPKVGHTLILNYKYHICDIYIEILQSPLLKEIYASKKELAIHASSHYIPFINADTGKPLIALDNYYFLNLISNSP